MAAPAEPMIGANKPEAKATKEDNIRWTPQMIELLIETFGTLVKNPQYETESGKNLKGIGWTKLQEV